MTQDSLIYKHRTLDPIDPKDIGTRQATDDDYNKRPDGYSRGHLNPNSHHAGKRGRAVLRGLSCVSCTLSKMYTRVLTCGRQNTVPGTWTREHRKEEDFKHKTFKNNYVLFMREMYSTQHFIITCYALIHPPITSFFCLYIIFYRWCFQSHYDPD